MLRQIQPDAAGIDIDATEIYVAIPDEHRAREVVRCFGTFTQDFHEAAKWLELCNIKSVAMKSTGVYWCMRARHGSPKAITATAPKIARNIFHLNRDRQSL